MIDGWRHKVVGSSEAEGFDERFAVAFIIGCGRSGTTIIGKSLGAHSQICYLNEPQDMWFSAWQSTDLWSPLAALRKGRIFHGAGDFKPKSAARLKAAMARAAGDKTMIVEKWPINAFRIELIDAVFPAAQFVWLKRSAWPVAKSIERCVEADASWWGIFDYKWRAIKAYALAQPEYASLVPLAEQSHFHRGLLEWRLSYDAMNAAFAKINPARVHAIAYDDFVASPLEHGQAITRFLGRPGCRNFNRFLIDRVRPGRQEDLSSRQDADARIIVGDR